MTEQAGYINETDLIAECEREAALAFLANDMQSDEIVCGIWATLSVLRRRGLINSQGLELIKQSGESK